MARVNMNYLKINGKKIVLTDAQVEGIKGAFGTEMGIRLSEFAPEDTLHLGKYEFFVLGHLGDETAIMLKNFLHEAEEFGMNNNYEGSYVDELCCEFAKEIEAIVGADNLVEHEVDLTSDDGLKDYGVIKRKMSLITANDYRRWVDVIDKHKVDKWWWLATPDTTPEHVNVYWCRCVSPSGNVHKINYDNNLFVRPVCILNSNIFVSK